MTSYHNRTYDDFDQLFLYRGDYWHTENWNVSGGISGGTYHFSNAANAAASFQFPVPAVAFYYYGFLRHDKNRGSNRICVDCSGDAGGFGIDTGDFISVVDGANPQPILLYSQRFSKPENHIVTLWNVRDPSIPNPGSRISLDRFELEVEDEAPAPQVLPTAQRRRDSIPVPTFVGALIGSNAALLLLGIGLWFWYRRREGRRRPRELDLASFGLPSTPPAPILGGWPQHPHLLASEYEINPLLLYQAPDSLSSAPGVPGSPASPLARYHTAGIYVDRR